jgi:hypothetical protein
MTSQEFRNLLERATQEVLAETRRYVEDVLPNECGYRCVTGPPRWDEPILDAAAVVGLLWRDGQTPEWIKVVVTSVEADRTVLHLLCGETSIDPTSAECKDAWARIRQPARELLPFLVLLPPVPAGWRVMVDGRPDMDRSVSEHGKYRLVQRRVV